MARRSQSTATTENSTAAGKGTAKKAPAKRNAASKATADSAETAAVPGLDDTAESEPDAETTVGSRRRWLPAVVVSTLCLAGLLYAAPLIVAHTSLRQRVLPTLMPDLPVTGHIGSASLGWFSPIVLRDVTIDDETGAPLLHVDSLSTGHQLSKMATSLTDLGSIRIERPRLHVVVRPDGSNVEDVLTKLAAMPASELPVPAFVVEVIDGQIEVVTAVDSASAESTGSTAKQTAKPATAAVVNATVTSSGAADKPLDIQCRLQPSGQKTTDQLEAKLSWLLPTSSPASTLGRGEIQLASSSYPLETLGPLQHRVAEGLRLQGRLQGDLHAEWDDTGEQLTFALSGNARIDGLDVTAAALGPDRFRLPGVEANGRVDYRESRLEFVDVSARSEVGGIKLVGVAHLDQLKNANMTDLLWGVLREEEYELSGDLDLAKIAGLLPSTLRVREGTEIRSGRLNWSLRGATEADRRAWTGALLATDLVAENHGQEIRWNQPIRLDYRLAAQPDGGVMIEKMDCQSDFLHLTGRGTMADAELTARCDLDRLATETGRFIDLSGIRLSGQMAAALRAKQTSPGQMSATAAVQVDRFALQAGEMRAWEEQKLILRMEADGTWAGTAPGQLERGLLTVNSAADQMTAELVQPVAWSNGPAEWPIKLQVRGNLATWANRLQPWMPLTGWTLAGNVDLQATAAVAPEKLNIQSAVVDLQSLQVLGHGLQLTEPRVRIETRGTWDQQRGQLISDRTTWASRSLSLRADDFALRLQDDRLPEMRGAIVFRGGVNELSRWWNEPQLQDAYRLGGVIGGDIRMTHAGEISQARWSVNLDQFTIDTLQAQPAASQPITGLWPRGGDGASPFGVPRAARTTSGSSGSWNRAWTEPRVTISGAGSYHSGQDRLSWDSLKVTSRLASLQTQGEVATAATQPAVSVTGTIGYDLANLLNVLRPYVGDGLKMTGREERAFELRGPLVVAGVSGSAPMTQPGQPYRAGGLSNRDSMAGPLSQLTGRGGVGWTSADIYGLKAGAGQLDADIHSGLVRFAPLDVSLADGRLRGTPRIRLDGSSPVLEMDAGRVIDEVQISEEVCDQWLKYVAPAMAQATRVQGRMSVDLKSLRIPVTTPKSGEVDGTLVIASAQVQPGPLAQQFLQLIGQVKAITRGQNAGQVGGGNWLTIDNQSVAFQMRDGRVYHRGLEMKAGDVVLRTEGSVGFDESLSLVAEIPLQEKWLGSSEIATALKGEVLRVPVSGTFSQPRIDNSVLTDLARRAATNSAGKSAGRH